MAFSDRTDGFTDRTRPTDMPSGGRTSPANDRTRPTDRTRTTDMPSGDRTQGSGTQDGRMKPTDKPDIPDKPQLNPAALCSDKSLLVVSLYLTVEPQGGDIRVDTVKGLSDLATTPSLTLYGDKINALKINVNGMECEY